MRFGPCNRRRRPWRYRHRRGPRRDCVFWGSAAPGDRYFCRFGRPWRSRGRGLRRLRGTKLRFAAAADQNRVIGPRSGALAHLSRRALFGWAAAILLANQLAYAVKDSSLASPTELVTGLVAVGTFQYLAWFVIFRLVLRSRPAAASRSDWLVAATVSLLVFVPTERIIWVAATAAGMQMLLYNRGDRRLRAAGVVLIALATQELWGHLLFELVASPVLRLEAGAVGRLLRTVRPGTAWHDNIVTAADGDGIVIQPYCSSFHNLSLALPCWLTIFHLRGDGEAMHWRAAVWGAAIAAAMIVLNIARLAAMAVSNHSYLYWHNGAGAQIFAVGASLLVLLLCLHTPGRRVSA